MLRKIISATSPFQPGEVAELAADAPRVVRRHVANFEADYMRLGWKMFPSIRRVYVNARARTELGWKPRHDFAAVLGRVAAGGDFRSPLAQVVGSKGYHAQSFADGPYPVA